MISALIDGPSFQVSPSSTHPTLPLPHTHSTGIWLNLVPASPRLLLLLDSLAKTKLELKRFCPQHPMSACCFNSTCHRLDTSPSPFTDSQTTHFKRLFLEFPNMVDQSWWDWWWASHWRHFSVCSAIKLDPLITPPSFPPSTSLEKQILLLVSCRIVSPIFRSLWGLTSCTKYLVNKCSSHPWRNSVK